MPATLKDIAARTNLSIRAVSFAIRGEQGVSEETRNRVLSVAQEIGYKPNMAARAMVQKRFGNIGLLLSSERGRSNLPGQLLDGIHAELEKQGSHLLVAKLPDEKLTSDGVVPRILTELAVDGLLINYTDHIPKKMVELIDSHNLPVIWINTKRPQDCVYADEEALGYEAARHLIRLGHNRIGFADFSVSRKDLPTKHYSRQDREIGYVRAMAEAGLKPEVFRGEESSIAMTGGDWAAESLKETGGPTAMVAATVTQVQSLVVGAARYGLKVGTDLHIVSIGAGTAGGYWPTALDVPEQAVGAAAVQALKLKIANPRKPQPAVVVPPSMWIVGNTCPAPTDGSAREVPA